MNQSQDNCTRQESEQNYYELLGIRSKTSFFVIKQILPEDAQENYFDKENSKVVRALKVISNSHLRAIYDDCLESNLSQDLIDEKLDFYISSLSFGNQEYTLSI